MGNYFMVSDNGQKLIVNSSNLNDELGQVDYIISGKTGTLSENKFIFKRIIIGNQVIG